MTFKRVKENWVTGVWNIALLKEAYAKGLITKEEYREIKQLPQMGSKNFSIQLLRQMEQEMKDRESGIMEDGD